MKHILSILLHIITWIGSLSIFTFTAFILVAIGSSIGWRFLELRGEDGFFLMWFLLTIILGIYSSIVALRYAYGNNYAIHPYRLLFRRNVSIATLIVAVFPIGVLLRAITPNVIWTMRNAHECIFTEHKDAAIFFLELAIITCTPIAVLTICAFVFYYSRPDRYLKHFLQ